MKKTKNLLLFILFAAITMVGCNTPIAEKSKEEVPQIGISAQGLSVKMDGNDIERTFTITSNIKVTKDIEVTVSTTAAASEATILTATVVIPSGETTTTGKVKFLGSAFPIGADAKDIKVSISSENAEVIDTQKEIKYTVVGANEPIVLPNAIIICETTDVFIAGSNAEVPVTIKLDAPAGQYIEFSLIYGDKNTIKEGMWTSVFPISINEGETEAQFNIVFDGTKFKKGFTGISHIVLTSNDAKIDDKQTLFINVTGVDPNKATLSTDGLNVVVGETDLSKTLTITLTENAIADVIFNVAVDGQNGDFELVNKTITVKKGEKTGTGVIKFLKKAFPIELMTGTAIVAITTSASGIVLNDPSKILFNIKGTGTAPMGTVSVDEKNVKVGAADKIVEFSVNISEVLTKTANFTITATGDKANSFTLNTSSVAISAGSTTAKGTITFKAASFPYDTDKANIKLSIASNDVIIINSGKSIDFMVSGVTINPNKEDVRYQFDSNRKQTVYVGSQAKTSLSLFFINEGRNRPSKTTNNIYPVITGGIEGIDYEFQKAIPIVIEPSDNPYSYVDINILPAAKGKTLIVELFCDEATIGTNKTTTIDVIFIEWLPITRAAPRAIIGDDGGTYATKMPSVQIGTDKYNHTYPCKEWNNLYDTESFDVVKGNNTIEIAAFCVSDDYYADATYLIVYADFNNDGDFSDPNEEISLMKLPTLGVAVANSKLFSTTMNVPASANAEFAVRIGIVTSKSKEITKVFQKGYFVNPGDVSTLRMSDFKAIVK